MTISEGHVPHANVPFGDFTWRHYLVSVHVGKVSSFLQGRGGDFISDYDELGHSSQPSFS